ncbi:PucR family transcriptional regulator ligand-binding domain-containing protein [Amycolatopsis acidiphila]|uniref:PucR family transcriptional regulator n=1 Tax=Amycolatopsis acidiphila TaxID=715473 RepID=A0A558A372_9PSEU|nr:PucR family transcriptional regulator [Amycolatopsis acidiphila]TVT18702.1 PucR family transcriptional regulator [Amycolatopsis acidiphila]UIJ61560.1 PucR family transcriptional regulator ligand-binding domain-containing protein [Amycolatopsis acidiphila]GHG59227.1 PucR family transcriptional regulator [Amycolatopsis acidiphila]
MTPVKTLLEIPELRMRLRTGSALLGREISRIYVTELPDPSRYVSAGEVVLTGLLWWREPGDADPFVAALARAGVAALAASGADSEGIPDDVVRACAQHRIPLLEVPADLSFAVVTERVVLALAADRGREPSGARKRLLSTADAPLPVLLRQGAQELGTGCWVLSGTGRVVGGTSPEAPPVEWFNPGRERTVHDEYTLLPIGGRFRVPWILAVRSPETDDLTDELAGLISLARARADQVRRMADRAAEPLFAALAAGSGDLTAAFTSSGRTDPARVVVARAPEDGAEFATELLAELLAEASASIGVLGEDAYAIAEADEHWPPEWASIARDRLSTVEHLVDLSRVFVGVSGPATVDGLRGATQEALHAVEVAARRGDRVGVVAGEDIAVHHLLVAGAPDELRRSVRERVLGTLLAYDAAQGTDLVRTVRVFLECSSSPTAAAKALHVHVNTLRYRITRASELLGLDLNDFPTQVDVYLALQA